MVNLKAATVADRCAVRSCLEGLAHRITNKNDLRPGVPSKTGPCRLAVWVVGEARLASKPCCLWPSSMYMNPTGGSFGVWNNLKRGFRNFLLAAGDSMESSRLLGGGCLFHVCSCRLRSGSCTCKFVLALGVSSWTPQVCEMVAQRYHK